MIYTGCILKNNSIGKRISVMSRHTLNDGITPHPSINCDSYDEWIKILAPSGKLVGGYYRKEIDWDLFSAKYLDELMEREKRLAVEKLAIRALSEDFTLLCIEESPEKCHRRLLAEECKKYLPQIKIQHR